MKQHLTTTLAVSLAVLFSASTLLAGGENCDRAKKQVNKDKAEKTCPFKKSKQVQKNDKDQSVAAKKAEAGKECDHSKKKKQTAAGGEKCDLKKKKDGKIVSKDCAGKDCEYCSEKKQQVSDRHMEKLVDDTLEVLDKQSSDRKKVRRQLKTLRHHLRMRKKQLASKNEKK